MMQGKVVYAMLLSLTLLGGLSSYSAEAGLASSKLSKVWESVSSLKQNLPHKFTAGALVLFTAWNMHTCVLANADACVTRDTALQQEISIRDFGAEIALLHDVISEHRAKLNYESPDIMLQVAAAFGDLNLVKFILNKYRDADTPYNLGASMTVAAQQGKLGVVVYLHSIHGTAYLEHAMHGAKHHGHQNVVDYLQVVQDATGVQQSYYDENSRDRWALVEGDLWVYEQELNTYLSDQQKIFLLAATFGDSHLVEYLIDKWQPDRATLSDALFNASYLGHMPLVRYLYGKVAGDGGLNSFELRTSAISFSAMNGHLDVVKFYYAEGASLEMMNLALRRASGFNKLGVVKYLHQRGADDIQGALAEAKLYANPTNAIYYRNGGNKETIKYLHEVLAE